MSRNEPWLTVVTVVKDLPLDFDRTVSSLESQTDQDFEFVVIDSSDDAHSVTKSCSRVAHAYFWTPPRGIYEAMNQGWRSATGEYIYFLNAGDVLHDPSTLSLVRSALSGDSSPAWAFGPVQIFGSDGSVTITPDWDYAAHRAALFALGNFPPHQGTFVKRTLLSEIGGFDTSYRIAADYAAFLQLSQLSNPRELDFVIADFTEGGASTTHWLESFKEFHAARRATFDPSGLASVIEYAHTAKQIAAVGFYREVWSKLVKR